MSATKVVFGDGIDSVLLNKAFTDTTPCVSPPDESVQSADGVGLQLAVDYQVDPVAVLVGTDAVVSSTKVFTFTNYTFTAKVGAKITISGAANAGNNGTFLISAVSGHTATTSTASGLVNETFDNSVIVTVTRSEAASTPTGAWTVTASNNYAPPLISTLGQAPTPGTFSDITSLFNSPAAIAAVTTASSQFVQARVDARTIQVTFTPTGGLGSARCYRFAKSWSR